MYHRSGDFMTLSIEEQNEWHRNCIAVLQIHNVLDVTYNDDKNYDEIIKTSQAGILVFAMLRDKLIKAGKNVQDLNDIWKEEVKKNFERRNND